MRLTRWTRRAGPCRSGDPPKQSVSSVVSFFRAFLEEFVLMRLCGEALVPSPLAGTDKALLCLPLYGCQSDLPLAKNGQISSMTSLNGHSEDNTLAEGVNFYEANKLQSLLTMLIHQLAARRQNDFFPSEKGSDPRGKG
ncbi:hypothetical protein F7725_019622 [Dissostichus mawsoni]|uniref:Uncharacterized protein n=1 Tax=Dissostichus mawsoni TaxID=36200 RepID=A0A7J5YL69_DISMA|nr:hypothetical protein F7725_019622 [Dissostichus mawsoni]